MPEQVQDFYPTPSTLSTCMYYTGLDPATMEKVYTPVSHHEKEMQRALIQYRNPDNYDLVKEALIKNGRTDLIGFGPKCLIPPRKISHNTGGKNFSSGKHKTVKIPQLITIRENIIVLVRVKEVPIINQNLLKKDISYE